MAVNVNRVVETLSGLKKYCSGETFPELQGTECFDFYDEKFLVAQACTGARFSVSLHESISWMVERENELIENEADRSSFPWCSFGWLLSDLSDDEVDGVGLYLWYESTSGTVVSSVYSVSDSQWVGGQVYVPEDRLTGKSLDRWVGRKLRCAQLWIEAAAWGASQDLLERWGRLYLGASQDPEAYEARRQFNVEVESAFGVCQMPTLEEALVAERAEWCFNRIQRAQEDAVEAAQNGNVGYIKSIAQLLREAASRLDRMAQEVTDGPGVEPGLAGTAIRPLPFRGRIEGSDWEEVDDYDFDDSDDSDWEESSND